MTPDELADHQRWVDDHHARVRAHLPATTDEDVVFLDQLERELDAAPHVSDYFQQLKPPYPQPMPDADVQDTVQRAIEDLAGQRRMAWLGDGAIQVHLIASLISNLQLRLDEAIVLAANQQVGLTDIARLAGTSPEQARQTIANTDPENDLAH